MNVFDAKLSSRTIPNALIKRSFHLSHQIIPRVPALSALHDPQDSVNSLSIPNCLVSCLVHQQLFSDSRRDTHQPDHIRDLSNREGRLEVFKLGRRISSKNIVKPALWATLQPQHIGRDPLATIRHCLSTIPGGDVKKPLVVMEYISRCIARAYQTRYATAIIQVRQMSQTCTDATGILTSP